MNIIEELSKKHSNDYIEAIKCVNDMIKKTSKCDNCKNEINRFFNNLFKFIVSIVDLENQLCDKYFEEKSFEELLELNNSLYFDIVEENYEESYGNPERMSEVLGEETGKLFAYIYTEVKSIILNAYEHDKYSMLTKIELLLDVYSLVVNSKDEVDCLKVKNEIKINRLKNFENLKKIDIYKRFNVENKTYTNILEKIDFSDLKYIFKYGVYVSENEIKSAEYINNLPEEKIRLIADVYTKAFQSGYTRDGKDFSKKETINIGYQIGYERIIKCAIENFHVMGFKPIIYINDYINGTRVYHTKPSRQMIYDHRFDEAIYLDEEYSKKVEEINKKVLEENKELIKAFAGPAVMEVFGEKPFSPLSKQSCYKLNQEQTQIKNHLTSIMGQEMNKYLPRSEYSFVIVAYPLPEIGDKYEEIFEEIIKVNTLDSDLYEKIHDKIIDVLDKADYIHIKGKGNNKTNIKVKMQTINDEEKETNFENCIATVNVPVGEVFTSPLLTGTNGILHVSEVYLRDLKYSNLEIEFIDGMIENYNCTNFQDEEENKKYIYENLLHPHKTLPIGEFAIGTNTTAYVMANKYNIVNILPILIVEKMGPHFAIGDTCFSWSEDLKVYNSNGKEIIARDNEVSIKRHEDVSKAYTYKHTDITIPYDEIEYIKAVTKEGESFDIILNGRFVVDGTQELNKAFE